MYEYGHTYVQRCDVQGKGDEDNYTVKDLKLVCEILQSKCNPLQ